jgi:hypothetical protein
VAVANNASNFVKTATVPPGTAFAKFSVISSDPTADFDLYVLSPSGQLFTAATPSASESLSLDNPQPGTYTIIANLYASPNNRPTKASVDAAILGANQGNATVTPNPIKMKNGKSGKLSFAWNNLTPGSYIGRLTFDGTSARTFVSVLVSASGTVSVVPNDDQEGEHGKGKLQNAGEDQSNNAP